MRLVSGNTLPGDHAVDDMRWAIGCLTVLVLACGKAGQKANVDVTAARGSVETRGIASALPSARNSVAVPASSPPTDRIKSELNFSCTEAGPDVPVVDEPPSRHVPRLLTAESAGLPEASIAYTTEGNLWLVSSDGRRRRTLGRGTHPRWLPGGRALLFIASPSDGLPRLYEAAVDCSARVRVLTEPLLAAGADGSPPSPFQIDELSYSVSPDGKYVTFSRPAPLGADLCLLEVASSVERKLLKNSFFGEPAWFPDSRSLAVVTGELEDSTLTTIDIRTGQTRKLSSLPRGGVAVAPDSRIIFESASGPGLAIEDRQVRLYQTDRTRGAAYALEGSNLGPGSYGSLRLSPDGAKLATSWSLWTGNGPAAIRDHGLALFSIPPTLPPTTTRPADLRAAGTPFAPNDGAILFSQPKTRNLSSGADGDRYSMGDPSWAPNSRHLVFALSYCGQSFIECRHQIVAVDTHAPKSALVFLANGTEPAWPP